MMATDLQILARAQLADWVNRMRADSDQARIINLLYHTTIEYLGSRGLTINVGRVAPPFTLDGYPITQAIADRLNLTAAGADRRTARTVEMETSTDGYRADIRWKETADA